MATPMAPRWRRAVAAHGSRLARFALVGASGVAVNMAMLYLLVESVGLHDLLGAAFATEAAILSNFTLNDRWTFRGAQPRASRLRRAWRYNLVAAGGLLISVAVLAALTRGLDWHYLLANVFAIGAGFVWNYAVNSCVTWSVATGREPVSAGPPPPPSTRTFRPPAAVTRRGAGS